MHTHKCIKCSAEYTDSDPEPYLCAPCVEVKNAIAKEIDAKMMNRPSKRETASELQIFDELAKKGGRGNVHVNIKDLGITL